VRAALRPITGDEKVARYFLGILGEQPGVEILEQSVNGQPGLLAQLDGTTVAVIATNVANDAITHLWIVMNPDKLRAWTDGAHS
jgi:RNA polymerase sigma-70 factor (ECF subfamily)